MASLGLVVAMLVAACSSAPGRGPPAPGRGGVQVPIIKVTDGDTVRVRYDGQDERVRLIGIDTPEVPWYGGRSECYGVEAGLYARHRLAGRSVRLVFGPDRRDRYGRLLAYVYVRGELFNLTLVRLGYARARPVSPNTGMADVLAGAEAQARAAGRGLWAECSGPH